MCRIVLLLQDEFFVSHKVILPQNGCFNNMLINSTIIYLAVEKKYVPLNAKNVFCV